MPVIGTFKPDKDGYAGTIRTLTLNAKVRIVANDSKHAAGAPDFRVLAGVSEIGAAWRKTAEDQSSYLSVRLDDPALPGPIRAALIEKTDGRVLARGQRGREASDGRLPRKRPPQFAFEVHDLLEIVFGAHAPDHACRSKLGRLGRLEQYGRLVPHPAHDRTAFPGRHVVDRIGEIDRHGFALGMVSFCLGRERPRPLAGRRHDRHEEWPVEFAFGEHASVITLHRGSSSPVAKLHRAAASVKSGANHVPRLRGRFTP